MATAGTSDLDSDSDSSLHQLSLELSQHPLLSESDDDATTPTDSIVVTERVTRSTLSASSGRRQSSSSHFSRRVSAGSYADHTASQESDHDQQEWAESQGRIRGLRHQVSELEARCEQLQDHNEELEMRNGALQDRMTDLQARNAEIEAHADFLRDDKAALQARVEELETRSVAVDVVEPASAASDVGAGDSAELIKQLEALQAELAAKDELAKQAQAEYELRISELEAGHKTEVQVLNEQMLQCDSDIDRLVNAVATLTQERGEARKALSKSEMARAQAEQELTSAHRRVAQLERELTETGNYVSALKKDIKSLRTSRGSGSGSGDSDTRDPQVYRKQLIIAKVKLAEATAAKDVGVKRIRDLEEQLAAVKFKFAEITAQAEDDAVKVEHYQAANERRTEQVKLLHRKLLESEAKLAAHVVLVEAYKTGKLRKGGKKRPAAPAENGVEESKGDGGAPGPARRSSIARWVSSKVRKAKK